DPGEYDPLCIYAYSFQPGTRTWRRQVISAGGRAAFGLDPKAVDVDGDGDIDLVAADRSGLFYFENLTAKGDKSGPTNREPPAPTYSDHAKLMVLKDEPTVAGGDGPERPVKTPLDWGQRRAHILGNVERVMGQLPGSIARVPLDVKVLKEERAEKYT